MPHHTIRDISRRSVTGGLAPQSGGGFAAGSHRVRFLEERGGHQDLRRGRPPHNPAGLWTNLELGATRVRIL